MKNILKYCKKTTFLFTLAMSVAAPATADDIFFVSGDVGNALEVFKAVVKPWEEATGHKVIVVPLPASSTDQFSQYRKWLAGGSSIVDVYQTDVIWAPQLAEHFLDLSQVAAKAIPDHFPSIIESQTVNGKLVALPMFTDAPALFYRKDLLEKYDLPVPATWEELTETAQTVQDGERDAGNGDLWGYVWQGNGYEGLTCNALEWVNSFGGGQIVEPDGTVSINNEAAVLALDTAASWVGTISPPDVVNYQEEEARGQWQAGNAVFMRNWTYAYGLGNADDSAIKGLFDVAPLPSGGGHGASAATLGGWNLAVSRYTPKQDVAISLVLYLSGPKAQKQRALLSASLPTLVALYDDPEIAAAQPIIPRWKEVFLNSVARPSAPTRERYNAVSKEVWTAFRKTLKGDGTAAENLAALEQILSPVK
jgi:trehalose/maltose transport system substrate-binding protein